MIISNARTCPLVSCYQLHVTRIIWCINGHFKAECQPELFLFRLHIYVTVPFYVYVTQSLSVCVWLLFMFLLYFFSLTFIGSAWSICFFIPITTAQWPPTAKDFYTRSYPLHYFLILILEKEPGFPFSMLSDKQGNYWYHFYNVFGMTWSLTGDWTRDLQHSKPALYH